MDILSQVIKDFDKRKTGTLRIASGEIRSVSGKIVHHTFDMSRETNNLIETVKNRKNLQTEQNTTYKNIVKINIVLDFFLKLN